MSGTRGAILDRVAAVVSAYHNGAAIVEQIKVKRAARRAIPPTKNLEESLARGPHAVEEVKQNGLERFGPAFAVGDGWCLLPVLFLVLSDCKIDIAINALKDILIELLGSLIVHLQNAQEDDNMTDFAILVDASDMGRMKAVHVLTELYMRLANAGPIIRESSQSIPFMTVDQARYVDRQQGQAIRPSPSPRNHMLPSPPPQNHILPDPRYRMLPRVQTVPWESESEAFRPTFEQGTPVRSNTETSVTHETLSEPSKGKKKRMFSFPSVHKPSFARDHTKRSLKTVGSSDGAHTNQGPDDGRATANNNSIFQVPVEDMPSLAITPQEPNPWVEVSASPVDATRPILGSPDLEKVKSPVTSYIGRPNQDSKTRLLENYCKGAYYLQVGLQKDGMKLRNQSIGFQGEGYYFACCSSKCAFEGPACRKGKEWGFDDTVRSSHGVNFRWSFLAKSHVAQSKVKGRMYHYRCIFCVLQGHDAPFYVGITAFLEHVSQHRGQYLDDPILQATMCVNDRVVMMEGDFDVNLTPLESNISKLRPSELLSPTVGGDRPLSNAISTSWSTSDESTWSSGPWG